MTTHRLLAGGCLLLGLAGCTLPRPPAVPSAPAVLAGWSAPLPHGGAVADLQRWWEQLGDPVLVELVGAAQSASPTVASAASRIAQARAARTAAGAALAPNLDAVGSLSRGTSQAAASPGGTGAAAPLAAPVTVGQLGLQAAWELDLFGGRAASRDAAQARLEGAQAGWHDARVAVAAETAASYLGWRNCERQLAVAANDARSRAETSRLLDLSMQAGFTARADAALARASAAEGRGRERQQRAACETEIKTLVALTGWPEDGLRARLAAAWPEPPATLLDTVPVLPARLLAQRPDVFAAELEVAAASAEVGAAQADRFPRLSLSGSIAAGTFRVAGTSLDAQTWSIGPLAVSLPLFDAGRRAANVEAAQARYEEAAALYRARARQAVREAEQALVALDSARARNADARLAAEGYRASFVATESRYRAGLASLVELEDARRTMLAAETALVGLQREALGAWINLYRASGGGWTREAGTTTARQNKTPGENDE
ncbi:MAG TPA: efflux transporter outer membrane subunit [Ramlibacter sp.]|jgi:NodT family efflux transporter outer membrane factor (OMF) lipoprotein|uniref:efflux transporter outer membrane subunit n=1 Tax=Ramlibacter sp. TaxID=1917967 RepID=UPI002D3DB468|nr:efflux transporter outer membrane subunit [Ramlibacter sp.]HZY17118.1 efflux transporter outer membrane subunit [Ramlibacter sp.]